MPDCTEFSLRWQTKLVLSKFPLSSETMISTDSPTLTIFLLCHNRPEYAECAINSILNQTNQSFRLIISDNSTNDQLHHLVISKFPALEIRQRIPSIPSLEHFNKCISEVDTDYFCLFHDDDLMEPQYVNSMLETIKHHPASVAYSCNAEVVDEYNVSKHAHFDSNKAEVTIENPRALAGRYFSRFPNGFAPFPAYIYRSSVVTKIPIDPESGGKYSDLAWLLEISKLGPLIWNSEKLIRYRIHSTNDGGFESVRDRLRLLRYLKKNIAVIGQTIIDDYRFFLYKKLCKSGGHNGKLPEKFARSARRHLMLYRFKRFLKRQTYMYLYFKLRKSLNLSI